MDSTRVTTHVEIAEYGADRVIDPTVSTHTQRVLTDYMDGPRHFKRALQWPFSQTSPTFQDMTQVCYVTAPCDLGTVLVASQGDAVCAIWLGDDAESLIAELVTAWPEATPACAQHEVQRHLTVVAQHLAQPAGTPLPNLKLRAHGTAFQQQVWAALQQIPAGQVISYSELARRVHRPRAVRAVAGACAANTCAILIPCHRVVRQDGSLSGYRWGEARKRALLTQEGAYPIPA